MTPRAGAARTAHAAEPRGVGGRGNDALARADDGRGATDPYRAIDRQADPRRFARILEARGSQPHQARLRRGFLSLAGVGPGLRVLDVGCGTGVVTRDAAARVGARGLVVGVDPSRALLRTARRLAGIAANGALPTFRAGDGLALPFGSASFDVTLAVTVLLHVPAGDQVLAEMRRVTRPGGRVGVLDQDFGTLALDVPDRALTRRIVDGHAERFYAEPWSGRTLARRLRLAGLARVRTRVFVVVDRVYDDYVRSMLERRVELAVRWRLVTAEEGTALAPKPGGRRRPRRLLHEPQLLRGRGRAPVSAPERRGTSRRALLRAALLTAIPGALCRRAGAAGPPAFDGARALRDVERLVAIGPRPAGSAALGRARAYIVTELRAAGWRVREHAFPARAPRGPLTVTNLVAEWPGRGPEIIAVGGHYDTKVFETFRFVGANDGGSSAALLIELGRALAPRLRAEPPPSTRWLVFFDGEEAQVEWSATDSLYGSRAMAAALQASGELTRLRALIVADMIGDRDLVIPRESQSTPWLAGIVWATARRLGLEQHFPDRSQTVEDDHAPFLDAGVAAALLIDFDYGGPPGRNAYWHTAEDTVDKLSAESLRIAGTVILESLPAIEAELARRAR